MARPSIELVAALRTTAARIASGAGYRWTHMGSCNCGHLAQTLTSLSPREIHQLALESAGDWSEQALEFCPSTGYPLDHLIGVMLEAGLTQRDIVDLERLTGRDVLLRLPPGQRDLDRRSRSDVVLYLSLWADLLEELLAECPDRSSDWRSKFPEAIAASS